MIARSAGALCALLILTPGLARASFAGPAQQIVPAARLAAAAERAARTLMTDLDRALAPALVITDQSVPPGAVEIVAGTPQANPNYVSVPVSIDIDGKLARTVYAGFRITNFVRTAVAAHDLAADAIVGPDDLTYARVPFNGRPGLDIETFVGRKVRSVIPSGAIVYPELTAVNLIVQAGMPAILIVHDGPVSIAADVVARSSGGLGEFVTIFDPQTQRTLSGVVTGPATIELTLPGGDS
jgi:flagella basal body P-ring formation protein FlgA